ncbi:MAG: type III PLP-dependent enzyme [Hyphomicrobiaceae bacterium]|nr:type III PLP-dependent enzyme [Hyphomicrobiaceae bacterium]
MDSFDNAYDFVTAKHPERATLGLRPHAAARAASWFLDNFPGEVAYAYKANSSVFLLGALYGAGIHSFDVASLPELEDAATIPRARLNYMHPVKPRTAIRRAYHEYGVTCFALDSHDELEKILDETGCADDLQLFVRIKVPAINSKIPLERKFGATADQAVQLLTRTRQYCNKLGVCFHVGSQTVTPHAFEMAFATLRKTIVEAGVVVDGVDVGGGFPACYSRERPSELIEFVNVIKKHFESLPVSSDCHLICEPGRALVAEAESLIVRVDARRGKELFITDGSYGVLFDAAHLKFQLPVRLVGQKSVKTQDCTSFSLWGPTCDSIDYIEGPFLLPNSVREGDYLEIGNIGAYGRAIASKFNGYGQYNEVILYDEPIYTMYPKSSNTFVQSV